MFFPNHVRGVRLECINSNNIPDNIKPHLTRMIKAMIEEEREMLKSIGNGRRPQIEFQNLETSFAPDTSILLLREGIDKVLGFSSCYNQGYDRRVIELIYIDPSIRGKGYGGLLMSQMLSNAPSIVEVAVLVNNEAAIKLYNKFGFFSTIMTLSRVK